MIRLLAVAALAACGTDPPDPHEKVACTWPDGQHGAPWSGTCDLACADRSIAESDVGPLCHTPIAGTCHSFEWMGYVGCCVGTSNTAVGFTECEP